MEITCKNIVQEFGTHRVLDDVSFSASFEHTLVLIGPSGGGKSTILRVLAGLIEPKAGEMTVNGKVVPFDQGSRRAYRQKIGMVFQAFNLFPHLTAFQNVLLPLEKVHRFPDAKERAQAALERFRLGNHGGKKPAQLSGGERQRVAIARALAVEPEFLVMDEPTSSLDPEMKAEVLEVISDLREAGRPLILVTHEMGFAREAADTVLFISGGQVTACQPATEFFTTPATPAAVRFLETVLRY